MIVPSILALMNRQIKISTGLFILCFMPGFAYTQNTTVASKTMIQTDSAPLKALVVKFLQWLGTDKKSDFEPLLQHPEDTVYTSIDWQAHKQRVAALEKTNLFTKEFVDNYQKIALYLDQELKTNKTKYAVGDLPPYGNDASPWCNCLDYPAGMWKRLQIVALKINNNAATFKWTWGNKYSYAAKAIKENNVWKIAALERFNMNAFSW